MITVRDLLNAFLDLLYPLHCRLCHVKLPEDRPGRLCEECERGLWTYLPQPICECCGQPTEIVGHEVRGPMFCSMCRYQRREFSRARSATRFAERMRDVIHLFKYAEKTDLAYPLGKILTGYAIRENLFERVDAIIPVPLHWRRRLRRGYNQAELLARELGRVSGLPVVDDALVRVRATRSQTALSLEARRRNVAGAFKLHDGELLRGTAVMLVDDVMTSGATCDEAARVLKQEGGVLSVLVLTLARAF